MRLPPLNALRAFEAAARNSSVHKAARELHVTPAAVSHQIKALEEFLGIMLFKRSPRRITLPPAGEACLPKRPAAFEQLAQAVAAARQPAHAGPVIVTDRNTVGQGQSVYVCVDIGASRFIIKNIIESYH